MYLMRLGAKFRSQVRGAQFFSVWAVGRGSKQSSQKLASLYNTIHYCCSVAVKSSFTYTKLFDFLPQFPYPNSTNLDFDTYLAGLILIIVRASLNHGTTIVVCWHSIPARKKCQCEFTVEFSITIPGEQIIAFLCCFTVKANNNRQDQDTHAPAAYTSTER